MIRSARVLYSYGTVRSSGPAAQRNVFTRPVLPKPVATILELILSILPYFKIRNCSFVRPSVTHSIRSRTSYASATGTSRYIWIIISEHCHFPLVSKPRNNFITTKDKKSQIVIELFGKYDDDDDDDMMMMMAMTMMMMLMTMMILFEIAYNALVLRLLRVVLRARSAGAVAP